MARPIWTGSVTFGLVSVPVSLYSATDDKTIHFHQVTRQNKDRVRYKRVNERTGKEVDWSDIVKGYDLGDGKYVTLDREELEQVAPGRSRTIEVSGFVGLDEIDPIYYQRTYYLLPAKRDEGRTYALLRDAMEQSGRAGIATLVLRDKQHLAAIRAEKSALVLETMFFADEVRDPTKQVDNIPSRNTARKAELNQALQLIEAMAMSWQPEAYEDTYREKVEQLIDAKREGEEIESAEPPPPPTNVVDLTEALQQSVQNIRQERGTGQQGSKGRARKSTRRKPSRPAEGLSELSKADLYDRAGELDVTGRSKMNRKQLEKAVKDASSSRPARKAS